MKKTNAILMILTAVLFNFLVSLMFASLTGIPVMLCFTVAMILAVRFGKPQLEAHGILRAGLLKEIWIAKIMENYYANDTFLSRAQDMSEFVNNNTINLADAGVDPDVLINNSTYPIPIVERTDTPLALPLDYYDTKNTVIRNAEAVQLSYNKMESVIRGHRNTLKQKTAAKAIHAYAPASNATLTPVFPTTGALNAVTNRLRFAVKDIINAQNVCDKINMPEDGRVMVMHPDHLMDIMLEDAQLFKQFADIESGKVKRLYSFDIYKTVLTPTYNSTTGVKKAFGAAAAGTDSPATVFFHESEVMKADGTVDMFARLKDPEARGDIIGFQKRFLGMPLRNKFIGAIYSAPNPA